MGCALGANRPIYLIDYHGLRQERMEDMIDHLSPCDRLRPHRPHWSWFVWEACKWAAGAVLLGVVFGLMGLGLTALGVIWP